MVVKMSKQPPPAPTASAVGPCPTIIQIVGRPGTESLPGTIAPPNHPSLMNNSCLVSEIFLHPKYPKYTLSPLYPINYFGSDYFITFDALTTGV